jgi:TrmH family RNA methyltransferase
VLRLPVVTGVNAAEALTRLKQSGIPLYAAHPGEAARGIQDAGLNPSAVVIGQEGSGVSDFWREQGRGLCIPMDAGCESLNAAMAATVVLWEGYRQLTGNS